MGKVIGTLLLCLVVGVGVSIVTPIIVFLFSAFLIGAVVIGSIALIIFLFRFDWKSLDDDDDDQDSSDRR